MTTEYSIQKMVSDGTLSTITLGIQYLQRNDIYMRIAGEETPQSGAPSGYTWYFVDNTTLKILPVVPNGVEVVVYRRTDINAMYNIYSQNAQFDEATIDENNQQLLYIAQEYLEQGIPGAGVDTLEFVRDDGTYTYYRIKRTDGSYSDEFAVPSAGSATKIVAREALRRSYAEAGYNLVDGSFEAGGTLTSATDVLLYEAQGKAYSWGGTLPKIVPANSTPSSTGGTGSAAWYDVSGIHGNYTAHLKHFKAVGNGITDDTAAVTAAIASGYALDWGGPDCVYRITSGIVLTLLSPVQWRSNGAKILLDSAVPVKAVIDLIVADTTNASAGKLIIDANRKAFTGLSLRSDGPGLTTDITLEDLDVRNVYRSSTAFSGGDGISITRGWRNVSLIRPIVTNCRMAVGAGVFGSQGIFGITIAGSSGNSARNVYIEDPFIESVMSEDPAYTADQDGIRLFNADNNTNKPFTASFELIGGKIKDCRGRSVKVQAENGRIQGLQLVRTTACDPGGVGALTQNADIEFQTGGGSVSDIEFHYDGFVPRAIVRFIQSAVTIPIASMPNIRGVRGVILGAKILDAVVRLTAASGGIAKMFANVSDINITAETPVSKVMSISSSNALNEMTVNLTNVLCPIADSLVELAGNSTKKRVYALNAHNTSGALAPAQSGGFAGEYVSLMHGSGFIAAKTVITDATSAVTRINAIAPDGVDNSGILRPIAFTLADGATFQLPVTGAANGVHMLIVSVGVPGGAGANAQAIFTVNSGGVLQITTGGSEFAVGTTTEPVTGNYRLWGSGMASAGPFISNHSGNSRVITCLQFG